MVKLTALTNFIIIPEPSLKTLSPRTISNYIDYHFNLLVFFKKGYLIPLFFHFTFYPSAPNLHPPGIRLFKVRNFSVFMSFSLLHYFF